jgi:hypothetical protein
MTYWGGFLCSLFTLGAMAENHIENSFLYEGTYSENYVMRWQFQSLCHHVYDPQTNVYAWPTHESGATFDPSRVKKGDLIFVRDVPKFMKKLHPKISAPYIMLTAGEYRDQVTPAHLSYLEDDKIIAWFAVHHDCYDTHPKFHQIPLGIYQDKKYYEPRKELTHYFARLRKQPKQKLLYSNYGDLRGMKPERAEVDHYFADKEFCFKVNERLPFLEYMEQMSEFKFVLSPRGYGPDTYRTWEALLVGSIPVVHTSQLDSLYAGLPVLIVDRWDRITEEYLEQKYAEITKKKWPIEKLFNEFWEHKILEVRDAYLRNS